MKIKKTIALFAVCTIVGANLIPMTASAHHNGGRHHNGSGSSTTVCSVKDCHKSGNHSHKGTTYGSRCSAYGHDHN